VEKKKGKEKRIHIKRKKRQGEGVAADYRESTKGVEAPQERKGKSRKFEGENFPCRESKKKNSPGPEALSTCWAGDSKKGGKR